ncbi:hypothetical protein MTO96_010893 [Rhipicephalus appendiculatus]
MSAKLQREQAQQPCKPVSKPDSVSRTRALAFLAVQRCMHKMRNANVLFLSRCRRRAAVQAPKHARESTGPLTNNEAPPTPVHSALPSFAGRCRKLKGAAAAEPAVPTRTRVGERVTGFRRQRAWQARTCSVPSRATGHPEWPPAEEEGPSCIFYYLDEAQRRPTH